MKSIIFVIGPSFSGKSHYIKNNFPDYKIVDLYDFQHGDKFVSIEKSYDLCLEALEDAVKNNDKVILEHTLLKRMRRPRFIDAVSKYGPVDVIALNPSLELLIAHSYKRCGKPMTSVHKDSLDIYELPQEGDGFRNIKILGDDDLNV